MISAVQADASRQPDRRWFGILSLLISFCLARRNIFFVWEDIVIILELYPVCSLCKKVKDLLLSLLSIYIMTFLSMRDILWTKIGFVYFMYTRHSIKEKASLRRFNLYKYTHASVLLMLLKTDALIDKLHRSCTQDERTCSFCFVFLRCMIRRWLRQRYWWITREIYFAVRKLENISIHSSENTDMGS